MKEITLNIQGMHCASCVNHVEKNLKRVDGVKQATVNLATEKASVNFGEPATADRLIEAVKKAGYEATAAHKQGDSSAGRSSMPGQNRETYRWKIRLLGCIALAVVTL